jgi:hypothetical protein
MHGVDLAPAVAQVAYPAADHGGKAGIIMPYRPDQVKGYFFGDFGDGRGVLCLFPYSIKSQAFLKKKDPEMAVLKPESGIFGHEKRRKASEPRLFSIKN